MKIKRLLLLFAALALFGQDHATYASLPDLSQLYLVNGT